MKKFTASQVRRDFHEIICLTWSIMLTIQVRQLNRRPDHGLALQPRQTLADLTGFTWKPDQFTGMAQLRTSKDIFALMRYLMIVLFSIVACKSLM